jgi:hypothetical protein
VTRVLLLQDKVLGEELGLLAADAASSRYSELSESHLFPITKAPSSLLQTSCCFSYLCCEWTTRLALCHHFRLDASCRVCFVQRSARIPTKQLTSNTIHHQSCGTDLWRWVPVDLRAVEVWIPGAWTGGRTYSDKSQANLAMAYTSQSSPRAREKLLRTSFNT